ncbi:MAG: histidyl-tRNA synthetase [Myxococcales bacterium]|nr:histidyl-tRNA synthetase [Myxococcales bacterium]
MTSAPKGARQLVAPWYCHGVLPTSDAGPDEAAKVRFVGRRAFAVFRAHGYRELIPTALEPAGHNARIGAPTMALPDGSELRADGMAALARAHSLSGKRGQFARRMMSGLLFDAAPAGRLRLGSYEVTCGVIFGSAGPAADAEVGALALALGADPGLSEAELVVSTVGDPGDQQRYLTAIAELRGLQCDRCQASPDPLRFFSCDEEGCRALAAAAPALREFVSTPALKHHEAVLATMEAAGIVARDDVRLAFGGGRYARTIVELRARATDGATLAVARGGRRDGLLAALGSAASPAVGLTLGLVRAAACVTPADASFEPGCEIFIAAQGTAARAWAFRAAAAERARGFRVDVDLGDGGWAEQLSRADEVHARVVVLCGEGERKNGEVQVRNMRTRETRRIGEGELTSELKRLLR